MNDHDDATRQAADDLPRLSDAAVSVIQQVQAERDRFKEGAERERTRADSEARAVETLQGQVRQVKAELDRWQSQNLRLANERDEAQRSANFWQALAEQWEREHQNTVLPYTSQLETERDTYRQRGIDAAEQYTRDRAALTTERDELAWQVEDMRCERDRLRLAWQSAQRRAGRMRVARDVIAQIGREERDELERDLRNARNTNIEECASRFRWAEEAAEMTRQRDVAEGKYGVAFEGRESAWADLERIITLCGEDPEDFEITAVPSLVERLVGHATQRHGEVQP